MSNFQKGLLFAFFSEGARSEGIPRETLSAKIQISYTYLMISDKKYQLTTFLFYPSPLQGSTEILTFFADTLIFLA